MNILTLGQGEIYQKLLLEILEEHSITHISLNWPEYKENLPKHKNLEIIYGNNILINDINAGNPDNKDVFLAFSQDDNINIMTSFMAKDIFQIKKVICGIQNLSKAESLKSANFQIVNISQIVINSTISII